ncbi:MAG: DUF1629 domain-containing protein [Ginsengibacter sp.]
MNQEFEYYLIHRKGDDTMPLLAGDDNCPTYLYEEGPMENPKLMSFRIRKPVPKNPKIVDYHSTPNSVISKKIHDVIAPLKIEGIQLLPSTIKVKDKELIKNYWAIHIYNRIKCLDLKLSKCTSDDDMLDDVEKLILDKKKLKAIPLAKRLVFRLEEDYSYQLYHVSIVEAIKAVDPVGVGFTNIENWNEESYFDN